MSKIIETASLMFRNGLFASRPCYLCSAILNVAFWRRSHGQPTPESHPHLLKPGYVTYAHTKEVYRQRRIKFMELLAERVMDSDLKKAGHIALIPSSSKTLMSENIPYTFRQNSDFLYLTGFKEADSLLVLHTDHGKTLPDHTSVLFLQEVDEYSERWDGAKTDVNHAISFLGVDKAFYVQQFSNYMSKFCSRYPTMAIWFDIFSKSTSVSQELVKDFMECTGKRIYDTPREIMHYLRLIKSEPEIKVLKKACEITSKAMEATMRFSHPLVSETTLGAKMEFECRALGADRAAFPFVVAGGNRANTIHYIANDQIVAPGETVLVDAGCEFDGYCSDLSRTWPVSGTFTDPQRIIYEIVLSVQEELIQICCDAENLDYLFKEMCRKMGRKLQEAGVIDSGASRSQTYSAAFSFCPHHVSHYLGMDVHDTSFITRGTPIKPGMVLTIEPGVYIRSSNGSVPKEFRGICVRIEDDILITSAGADVLTTCVKSVKEIEDLLATRKERE